MKISVTNESITAMRSNNVRRYYVEKEGIYAVSFKSYSFGESRTGNTTTKLEFIVTDKDEEGLEVSMTLPVTGTDVKGRPNSYRILGFLSAWGIDVDALKGQEFDLERELDKLVGNDGFVSIKNELYMRTKTGTMAASAKVAGFWKKSDVEDLRNNKPHLIRYESKVDLKLIGTPAENYVATDAPF